LHNARMEGWLSDHEVLIRRKIKRQARYFRRDLIAGKEWPLPFLDHPSGETDIGDDVLISPDGKWLLRDSERAPGVISIDGKNYYKSNSACLFAEPSHTGWPFADVSWMADSCSSVRFNKYLIGGFTLTEFDTTPATSATIDDIRHPQA